MVNGWPDISKIMIGDVLTVTEDTTTIDALKLMDERGVGAVVVTRGDSPVGMFTERDLLSKIVLPGKDPSRVPIKSVMTKNVVSVKPECTFGQAYTKMVEGNFRHLLVVGKGRKLEGIISIKDLAHLREHALEAEVEAKTAQIVEAHRKLDESLAYIRREMAFAGNFQRQLIEKKFPSARGMKVSHVYRLADSIGGDYLSVVQIDRDNFGILVADVMGHGITSAMIAVEVKMQYDLLSRNVFFPGMLISEMNRTISSLMPPGFFVAGCCCVLNVRTLHLRYTQFGLPGPGVYRADSGKYEQFAPCQVPMGIKLDASYPEKEMYMMPGDKLFLFTDGCIEQKNQKNKLLGMSRFVKRFSQLAAEGKPGILDKLYKMVIEHTGHEKHSDDIAMLLIEFSKNGKVHPAPELR